MNVDLLLYIKGLPGLLLGQCASSFYVDCSYSPAFLLIPSCPSPEDSLRPLVALQLLFVGSFGFSLHPCYHYGVQTKGDTSPGMLFSSPRH